jgi:CheY-like chemotaxis protein
VPTAALLLFATIVHAKTAKASAFTTDAPRIAPISTRRRSTKGVTPHVLIADANARTRQTREEQLVAAGFRVSLARTGFEAIVKASCRLPDLILLDDSLQGLGAPETGRLLTTCPATAHIPVLEISHGRRVPRTVLTDLRRRAAV